MKAPAHEQAIYNENIVGNGAHDVPSLANVIHHLAPAFSSVRHKCRTLHAPQCRERQSLPCDFTPTSRLAGDPIIGEVVCKANRRGCPLFNVIHHTVIIHFSLFTIHLFMRTVGDAGPYNAIPFDMTI